MANIGNTRTVQESEMYSRVGWTLLGGLLLSIAVMALGLLVGAIHGGSTTQVFRLNDVWSNLTGGKAAAILDTGILLLFATPLIAVLVALGEFSRQRDRDFALVTVALLLLLCIGFAVALH